MIAKCVRGHIAICLIGIFGVGAVALWAQTEGVGEISANESGLSAGRSVLAPAAADGAEADAAAPSEETASGAAGGATDSGSEGSAPAFESQVVRKPGAPPVNKENDPVGFSPPSLMHTVGSLLIVLAVIIAATYGFRRLTLGRRVGGRSKGIELLARSSVNPKQSLCLVKLGGRLLLVGLSPNHMAALETIEDPEEVAQVLGQLEASKSHSVSHSFSRMFQREGDYYADTEAQEGQGEDYGERGAQPWRQARGELSSLLSKVKGLSRMRFRS